MSQKNYDKLFSKDIIIAKKKLTIINIIPYEKYLKTREQYSQTTTYYFGLYPVIKGLDISFGVDSYVQSSQSGGEETKTSLSMDLKKSFMNDRAQFEVSGRLNDVYKQPGASDLSLNNISFEYRLDSAATKHLKVYNEHTYEDVFDGEVIKAGIGMTYRKQYWNFSDIWKRKEKNSREKK
jgi:hypothetical protein